MIAVDTQILVYAHREDSTWHPSALQTVTELAEGVQPWAITWPSVAEFFAIVTHAGIYRPASTFAQALTQLDAWFESPTLSLMAEDEGSWTNLRILIAQAKISGPAVYDARIAALCLGYGVTELLTADRDFLRFPALRVRNPLI